MKWSQKQLDILIEMYPEHRAEDIAVNIGRSVRSVYNMAYLLRLSKSKEFFLRLSEPLLVAGAAFRYKKGRTPENKGKKWGDYMSAKNIAKCEKTQFKKGNIPSNHCPVGTERIVRDGYIEVKIEGRQRWMLKHRLIWEQIHGKIPFGHNIQFKDGNPQNCHIDNLYMIARKKQMINNSGSVNMSDGMVAVWLSGNYGKNKEEIAAFKENKPLLEVKRNQLKLQRKIKKIEFKK